MKKLSLEERAKKLLRYKITGKGKIPNPFTPDFVEEVQYLVKKIYVAKLGENIKCLSYNPTPEGIKWAFQK